MRIVGDDEFDQALFAWRDGGLRQRSAAHENEHCSPLPHIWFIRERATEEVNALLDKAGIPRFD